MPVESPKQFELSTLEELLQSIESKGRYSSGLWCAVFGSLGVLLLVAVYFLHCEKLISAYWLYFLCVLSGACLVGAGIINRQSKQSEIVIKYLDKEAIIKRIAKLKM